MTSSLKNWPPWSALKIFGFLSFVVVLAEDVGCSLHQGLLPGLDLAGMDLKPDGQLGHRLLPLHRLQSYSGLKLCPPRAGISSVLVTRPAPPLQLIRF